MNKKIFFVRVITYFLLLPIFCLDALIKNHIEKNCIIKKWTFTLSIYFFCPFFTNITLRAPTSRSIFL